MNNTGKAVAKNIIITTSILALASLLCFFLKSVSTADTHVPLIFVLAVLCISRLTTGYVYGILASFIAVIAVNYVFTYPYFELNFSITGYPLTFLVMFAVSVIVSTLTTQIMRQKDIGLAMEREKIRSNLLRSVSHDIRTPLTSIVGNASALLEQKDSLSEAEKEALLQGIRQEGRWLSRIVENILSITRISGNEEILNMKDELVEEVVGSAVLKFKKRSPEAVISVKIPEEPLLVPMDPILVEQVLINLLDNAYEHGEEPGTIGIIVGADDDTVSFAVEDEGIGFSQELLPHIFDGTLPLRNKDTDLKSNMQIGLSVCMSIVKAHRGEMYAQNRSEGGARVSFILPLKRA